MQKSGFISMNGAGHLHYCSLCATNIANKNWTLSISHNANFYLVEYILTEMYVSSSDMLCLARDFFCKLMMSS